MRGENFDSVQYDPRFGVEALGEDIVEEQRERVPERGAVLCADSFEFQHRAARIGERVHAMLIGKFGGKIAEVVSPHVRDFARGMVSME
jgi:hypothetical protein